MKQELVNDDSPLDAHLQAVLPGVHHRMEVNRHEIVGLRGDVRRLTTAVETSTEIFNNRVDEIIQVNEEKNAALGRMHIMVGSKLLNRSSSEEEEEGEEGASCSSPPRIGRTRRLPRRRSEEQEQECPKYHLSPSPKTLFAIYNEWFGGGPDFEDIPVPGGIAALEDKFKARWRRHFEPCEVKEFSRRRMCINAIAAYATREGVSQAASLMQLNKIYEEEAKKKVPMMANIVQDMGLIEKKAKRGKAKKKDQEMTEAAE
jgi:hypothetical protein